MVMNNAIETMAELVGNQLKLVDLSHNLEVGMPSCLTHARFGRVQHEAIEYGDAFTHAALIMSEHTGTHMDAPNHHIPDSDYTIEKFRWSVFSAAVSSLMQAILARMNACP